MPPVSASNVRFSAYYFLLEINLSIFYLFYLKVFAVGVKSLKGLKSDGITLTFIFYFN